jgi:hypothetical protein
MAFNPVGLLVGPRDALRAAVAARGGDVAGVVFHTDSEETREAIGPRPSRPGGERSHQRVRVRWQDHRDAVPCPGERYVEHP